MGYKDIIKLGILRLELFLDNNKKQKAAIRKRGKQKIFVVGFNKTGTTSVYRALKDFDLIVGNQRKAELLIRKVMANDLKRLINYCHCAEAFQDIPFSKPGIFKELDQVFANSKFVLTIRDSPEQWFNSILKFHSKKFGQNGATPTIEDLKAARYIYKGWVHESHVWTYGHDLYNKEKYMTIYNNHISDVKEYFKDRPEDLLVINVAEKDSYKKLCHFIGQTPLRDTFEWMNKT